MMEKPLIRLAVGILRTIPEPVAYPLIRLAGTVRRRYAVRRKIPEMIIFFITNRCNAACDHCFYWKEVAGAADEMSIQEIGKLSKSLRGVKAISLTGGEPFLREDLADIVRLFSDAGVSIISIPTNGIRFEKIIDFAKNMSAIIGHATLKINVSIDGPREWHDHIRNVKGCYDRAMKTIMGLKAVMETRDNLSVAVATTVTHGNLPYLKDFLPELCRLNVPLIVSPVRGGGNNTIGIPVNIRRDLNPQNADILVSAEEMDHLRSLLTAAANKQGFVNWSAFQQVKLEMMGNVMKHQHRMLDCLAGYADGVIYNNGDVALCEPTKPFGNLRDVDMDFKSLWWSKAADDMRKRTRGCFCIHPCNLGTNMKYDADCLNKIIRNPK